MSKTDKETGFISHLTELRQRLINSIFFLAILFVFCYFFSEHIYGFLVEPYANAVKDDGLERRLIFTALQETFLTYLKVSFFAAFFATSPFILIQVWKFIAPGLYKNEKRALLPYLIATPTLFLLGAMLVYYLVMPLPLRWLWSFEPSGKLIILRINWQPRFVYAFLIVFLLLMPTTIRYLNTKKIVSEFGITDKNIVLSDGTNIQLNAGSALSYSKDYNIKNREVFLDGEAYFDVTKSQFPFIVSTDYAQVTVCLLYTSPSPRDS